MTVLLEDKASGQSLIQELRRTTNLPIIPQKADSDKISRVCTIAPLIEAGKVFVLQDRPWVSDFLEECGQFPLAPHDDQIDALTYGLTYLSSSVGMWGRL